MIIIFDKKLQCCNYGRMNTNTRTIEGFRIVLVLNSPFSFVAPRTELLFKNFIASIVRNHILLILFKTVNVLASLTKEKNN